MAVSDYSGLAFELILQPSLLSEKLFSKCKDDEDQRKVEAEIIGVLQEFLLQLISVPNLSNKIEPGFLSENTQRKRSFIQLMALQIHAFFQWDLDLIQKHLPLNLQSQLLETLLWTCRRSQTVFMAEKEKIGAGEALLLTKLEKCSAFAIHLYMRWVLRTFMTLNDPSPSGNKAQLYGTNFACSGNSLSQEIVMQLNSMRFSAVETLQKFIPSANSSIPSPQSFRVNSSTLETECLNTDWVNLDSSMVVRQTSFDVSAYHFFIENYAASEKYLQNVEAPISLSGDSSAFEGYKIALSSDDKAAEYEKDIPYERRVLSELQAWSIPNSDYGRKLTEENALFRLEQNLPPNYETFNAGVSVWTGDDFKNCLMKALCSPVEPNIYAEERLVFSEKSLPKQTSKQNPKFKKFELMSCLLREKCPEKIYKYVVELHKMNVNVKLVASRWNIDEAQRGVLLAAASLVGSGPRAQGPDCDYPMILLAKLKQIRDLKSYLDLQDYLNALSRFVSEKGRQDKAKIALFETKLNIQPLYVRMLHFNDPNAPGEEKRFPAVFVSQVRESFNVMLATTDSSSPHDRVIMEEIIATLLNLGEFEFVMTTGKDLQWKVIELASLISTLVLHFRGKNELPPAEVKQVLQNAESILITVVQGEVTSKRHRDSASNHISDKKLILGFLSKLRHEDATDLIKSFYVSCFNSTVTDASQTIQNNLFSWPVSTKASTVNADALLALLADLTEENQDGFRTRAEVYFAQGNYPAAMKYYLESLVISTNYFTPYKSGLQPTSLEWEKILQKMIRCSTELNLHLQTAVLCQFLTSDCDYSTSFKALEERNSHDAMDPLYDYMWDVTLLEYLVSMHSKRGEISRKRKALEVISQLDINTNNHEEILREAKSTRKSAFFRYLCKAFL